MTAGKNKIVCHIAAGKTMEQFLCMEVNKQKNIKSVHTPVTPKPISSIALAQCDTGCVANTFPTRAQVSKKA